MRQWCIGILFTLYASANALASILNGVDVLVARNFDTLSGQRVGLITNHTGIDREGRSTISLLADARNVTLVRLFSPEHGIEGKLDIPEIANARDGRTGLDIVSLYGDARKPSPVSLAGIDTLGFDIQDIGTRFYTYVSTMGLAMQAAAENGVRFVVLDRVNPIGGLAVEGPVLDQGLESFVGFHTIAVRHGMTVGELARLFNAELDLGLDLEVVPVEGWSREQSFPGTGLGWVDPSPNMRSVEAALLYPGIGLLETTNVSVGRGTARPFEVFGAPWLDAHALIAYLESEALPGLRFHPVDFEPEASVYAGERCEGVRFEITDPAAVRSVATGLAIARWLRLHHATEWDMTRFNRLLGDAQVFAAVRDATALERIVADYAEELDAFRGRRSDYLIYD
jgi:uncharacterized protein YbbC (DUF1343 family)